MILLDTDHTTHLKYPESERGRKLIERMEAASASDSFGVAIVTVEERMRGWLAVIAKERSALRQVVGYRELEQLLPRPRKDAAAPTRVSFSSGIPPRPPWHAPIMTVCGPDRHTIPHR
jgi:hypothetical protein